VLTGERRSPDSGRFSAAVGVGLRRSGAGRAPAGVFRSFVAHLPVQELIREVLA
jgi:hypothetical protein